MINIVHLSDLHLAPETFEDQKQVINALLADLEQFASSGPKIHAVIFSGDLVARGTYDATVCDWLADQFFPNLLAAARCPQDRVFLAPGNHDMNLRARDAVLQPALDQLTTRASVGAFVDTAAKHQSILSHQDEFARLRARIQTAPSLLKHPLVTAHRFTVDAFEVGIACLHSAWRCNGRPHDQDYGSLLIGERQVELASDALRGCQLSIAVTHHPLSWLSPFDQSATNRALFQKFDALFHGHNHNPNAEQLAYPSASLFISNAGCLYQSRDYFNGYSRIQIDPSARVWQVEAREYYDQRRAFDNALRFAPNGKATFSVLSKDAQSSLLLYPSEQYLAIASEKLNQTLLSANISDIAPKHLNALFVEPHLGRASERKLGSQGDEQSEDTHSLRELLKSPKATLILGRRESGRTTLLAYFCANAHNPEFSSNPRYGVYINLGSARAASRAQLLEMMVQFSAGELRRAELLQLLGEGRVTLCIDNVSLRDTKHVTLISALAKEFPKNKLVLAASEDVSRSLTSTSIPDFGVEVDVTYLHSFGRKQTRQLVQKWYGETSVKVRPKVDNLLSLLGRLNIPRSPFLLTILIWIQERGISFSPVNQAALIDAFIDGLLEKLYEAKERSSLDSTIKRDFLRELALHMHRVASTTLSTPTLESFAVEYLNSRALPFSINDLIPELLAKGILVDFGQEIGFKFECFRSFFLAANLSTAQELRAIAMSEDRFFELTREIDLYTGLHRDSKELLEHFVSLIGKLHQPVSLDLTATVFDDIDAEGSPLSKEKREMIMAEFVAKRLSHEEQEELLDSMDGATLVVHRASSTSAVRSDAVDLRPYALFLSALRICSIVLRNCELVDDASLKGKAYGVLIELWSEALLGVLLAVDISDEPIDKDLIPGLGDLAPGSVKHFVKVMVPTVILAVLREALGTPKLERVMIEHLDRSTQNIERLLDTFLYADLELPKYPQRLRDLAMRCQSKYQLELIFFKTFSILMLKQLSDAESSQLTTLVADLFGKLSSAGEKLKDDMSKQQFLAKLRKRGLVTNVRKGK